MVPIAPSVNRINRFKPHTEEPLARHGVPINDFNGYLHAIPQLYPSSGCERPRRRHNGTLRIVSVGFAFASLGRLLYPRF